MIKKDKIMLKRLEIKSTKSKIGVTNLTWVNEEVKEIEKVYGVCNKLNAMYFCF